MTYPFWPTGEFAHLAGASTGLAQEVREAADPSRQLEKSPAYANFRSLALTTRQFSNRLVPKPPERPKRGRARACAKFGSSSSFASLTSRRPCQQLAATTAALGGRAWSALATDQGLLVIFLRGAYDAMNMVIPTSSDFYYESRPTIAIPRPDPANPNAALPLDSDWSLHPVLEDNLYRHQPFTRLPEAEAEQQARFWFGGHLRRPRVAGGSATGVDRVSLAVFLRCCLFASRFATAS